MPTYINPNNIPLSVAVFLATDNYEYIPGAISATAFLKSTRQLILSKRIPDEENLIDISSLVKSRVGSAIHDGIENSWVRNYRNAMLSLGYTEDLIARVKINPDPDTVEPQDIPVYLEQRGTKVIDGVTVTGKFDFVAEGRIEDFKSTSTFTWSNHDKDVDYQIQGSIYRWLNPKIVTEDHMAIEFLFTDWKGGFVNSSANYPDQPIKQKLIPLLSVEDTEIFMRNKLAELEQAQHLPESELPLCSDRELWRKPPAYKYYKNPEKRSRSTKNFDNPADAYERKAKDGDVGVVVEKPGEVIACKFCSAFPVCTQKDALIADGSLDLS